jgi:hypothetical protein
MKQRLWQSQSAGRRSTHRAQASRRHGHDKGQREALLFYRIYLYYPITLLLAATGSERWRAGGLEGLSGARGGPSWIEGEGKGGSETAAIWQVGGDGCAGRGQCAGGRAALYSLAEEQRSSTFKAKAKGPSKEHPRNARSLTGPCWRAGTVWSVW